MNRTGGILLEVLISLALFVGAALAILRATSQADADRKTECSWIPGTPRPDPAAPVTPEDVHAAVRSSASAVRTASGSRQLNISFRPLAVRPSRRGGG